MFKGIYNGKQYHKADIAAVLSRAWSAGVERIIVRSCIVVQFTLEVCVLVMNLWYVGSPFFML